MNAITPTSIPRGSVVVGYDGSEHAEAALAWAGAYAEREQQPLVVLHAAGRVYYAYDEVMGSWDPEAAHAGARDIALRGVERVTEQHPTVTATTATSLLGSAAALTEASAHAGLVVVGSRGHGRLRGSLLGSTGFALSAHAYCPVVVVPHGEHPLPDDAHPVVVGVDGSTSSEHAVRTGVVMAQRGGSPLVVASAWRRPNPDPWGVPPPGFPSLQQAIEAAEQSATTATDSAARLAHSLAPDLTVKTRTAEGRPEDVLHELSEDGALVVLGARGRGDLASLLLGSTSRAVLHHTPVPVVVVR